MPPVKLIVLTLIALGSVPAEAAPARSYHCEGKVLALDFREDLGRTCPQLKYYLQHAYRVSCRAPYHRQEMGCRKL